MKYNKEAKQVKKRIAISTLLALVLLLTLAGTAFAYDSELVLNNKDAGWNEIKGDGIRGVLQYNSEGEVFDYSFRAKGMAANTNYDLIYYADPWPGANSILINSYTTGGDSKIVETPGSLDTGSLPVEADANDGAKIWLVDSADYNGGSWTAWNPSNYLFERNLITYTKTTPVLEPRVQIEPPLPNFTLYIQGGNQQYPFIKTDPRDMWSVTSYLSCSVSQEGLLGRQLYRVDIPEGTSVPTWVDLRMMNGEIYFSPQCDFSQPVTLLKFVDGDWEEAVSFTKIRNGKAIPIQDNPYQTDDCIIP